MKNIVLSLTSHQQRFSTLHLCLQRLIKQTLTPGRIVLYLDADVAWHELPQNVINFQNYGLEIIITQDKLKSHAKYYYAISRYSDCIVITVDDDVFYPLTLIESLYRMHKTYPQAVVGTRVHRLRVYPDGTPKPYNTWDMEYKEITTPSLQLFATGVGGVLYPPHCLHCDVFSQDQISKLCLFGDDLWLKIMQLRVKTPVVYAPIKDAGHFAKIPGCDESGLYRINLLKNRNDEYLSKILAFYGLNLGDLICN